MQTCIPKTQEYILFTGHFHRRKGSELPLSPDNKAGVSDPQTSPRHFQHCSSEHSRQWRLRYSSAGRGGVHLPSTHKVPVCKFSPTTQLNKQRNPIEWRLSNSKLAQVSRISRAKEKEHGRNVYTPLIPSWKDQCWKLPASRESLTFTGWLVSLPEQSILQGHTWFGKSDPGCPSSLAEQLRNHGYILFSKNLCPWRTVKIEILPPSIPNRPLTTKQKAGWRL